MILIESDCGLIGDALCTLPAIVKLSDRHPTQEVVVHAANKGVFDLVDFGERQIRVLGWEDSLEGAAPTRTYTIELLKVFDTFVQHLHMAQAHLAWFKLPVPKRPFEYIPYKRLPTEEAAKLPSYSFVVSPWSRSDLDHNKAWFEDRWEALFTSRLFKASSIAILGSRDDARPWDLPNVTYEYGRSLKEVAGLLKRVSRCVVSIDNGISHLAHLTGVPHALLYPACLPRGWVMNHNRNAWSIIAEPKKVEPHHMLELILHALKNR